MTTPPSPISPPNLQSQFDSIWGSKAPAANAPSQSRAQEIRNLGKQAADAKQVEDAKSGTAADKSMSVPSRLGAFLKPIATSIGDTAKRMGADITTSGQNVESAISGTGPYSGQGTIQRATGAVSEAASAPLKVASEVLPQPVREGISKVGETAGGVVNWLGDKLGSTKLAQDFVTKHPDAAKTLEGMAGTASNLGGISGNILAVGGGVEGTGKLAGKIDEASGSVMKGMAESAKPAETSSVVKPVVDSPEQTARLSKIQENISPKITSKETQKIINDSRLTRGKDSLLFGKKPDIVAQSEAVQKASRVIDEQIPNADKMTDAELSTAIDGKTTELAKGLSTEMKTVQIKPETTGKVVDAWKELKNEQQTTPEFLDNKAGNKAFQGKFENYLKQLEWDITDTSGKFKSPTPKTMDDIWEVRKAYDNSIPSNIKNATENSSPVLQGRKTMWLENRAILNSAINDTASGLGDTSKKAFSDMSSMYDAKQNILSKAKVDLEGKAGLLPNSPKQLLKWGLGAGITLVGGDLLLRKLGL